VSAACCIDVPQPDGGDCPFCAYLSGQRPYAIAWRSDRTAILVTREPRGHPHLLVVPVRHCETVLDVTDEEAGELMVATREAARAIDAVFCRPAIAVWQNNGVDAGQAIGHMHVHVAGTLAGGGTDRGRVVEVPLADAERTAGQLRPHLLQGLGGGPQ
jgi:histidine triad (HIT) family protein